MSTHPTVSRWLEMSREQRDEVYCNASPGSIPGGDTQGTVMASSGALARALAGLAGLLAWQGKVFDLFGNGGETGVLVNKVTPFGIRLIVAKVYRDQSWMDARDTIVIDYSRTSLLCRAVRDEIREVEPGVWLGKVWLGKLRVADFALTPPQR